MANPSAPAYEPDKWNSSVTSEMRDDFYRNFRDPILNILIRERSYSDARLDDFSRKLIARHPDASPERRGWDIQSALDKFFEYDAIYKDDLKLAQRYEIDAQTFPRFKEAALILHKAYGAQDYANCFVYAMNDHRDNAPPTPGKAGDPPMKRMDARNYESFQAALLEDVIAEGAVNGGANAPAVPGYYRVAVYSLHNPEPKGDNDNIFDMHFVREDRDGGWSHKFGSNPVTTKDKAGNDITDPATADLGNYKFMTYVHVPEGGLGVGAHRPRGGQALDLNSLASQIAGSTEQKAEEQPVQRAAPLSRAPAEYAP